MADITFAGQQFRIVEAVSLMALMRFAKVSKTVTSDADGEMVGLAATYDLLQACITADEWQRFEDLAVSSGADESALMQVVADTIEALQSRPTSRPSGSSERPPIASTTSPGSLSSAVTAREQQGRPDLAQVHHLAEHSRASA